MYDKVICEICKRKMGLITSQHLKTHGLTKKDYIKKFPNSKLVSQKILDIRKDNCLKMKGKTKKVNCEKCGKELETPKSNHWKFICEECREAEKFPNKKYIPEKDLVVCQICWIGLEQITTSHLSLHNMTIEEYKNKFPKVWLTNKKIREDRRKRGLKNNPTKRKHIRQKMSLAQRYTSERYIQKYPWVFPTIEKIRDYLGVIEVQCKTCKKWFHPTPIQMQERIRALTYGSDGQFLYCSEECKKKCPIYRLNPSQFLSCGTEKPYTDSEYQIFREEVLRRQREEFGYNFCELCEREKHLHVHHEKPKKTHPSMTLDPDNGIVLCEDCHLNKIHTEECSRAALANKC